MPHFRSVTHSPYALALGIFGALWINACGSRTPLDLSEAGGSAGVAGAAGAGAVGGNSQGGFGGSPEGGFGGNSQGGFGGNSQGGFGGSPEGGFGGNSQGGFGGNSQGGFGGNSQGGFGGNSQGGFGGTGCSADCSTCTTCWDTCTCSGADPNICQQVCGNVGGSSGQGGFGGNSQGGFGGNSQGGFGGSVAGAAGFGGSGGTGVVCGGQVCTPVNVLGAIELPACCAGAAGNACGVDTTVVSGVPGIPIGCIRKNQPGSFDPSCAPLDTPAGQAAGCCKPSGVCGNDLSLAELGCVETSSWGGPPPQKCGFGGQGGAGGQGGFGGQGGMGGFGATGGTAGAGGVGGSPGDCCTANNGVGCDQPQVSACVCAQDNYCCQVNWDSICANEVEQFGCGSCGSGTGGSAGFGGAGGVGGQGGFGGTTGGQGGFGGVGTGGIGTGGAAFGGAAGVGATGGNGGSGGIEACIDLATDACEVCTCGSCYNRLDSCLKDTGCTDIIDCISGTGCSGFGCYQFGTCRGVIDANGGLFGSSLNRVVQLSNCINQSGCPCN